MQVCIINSFEIDFHYAALAGLKFDVEQACHKLRIPLSPPPECWV